MRSAGAARQGLRQGVHELELAAASEHEQSVSSLLVHPDLDLRQEPWHALDLVDQTTTPKPSQQALRVRLGELAGLEVLEIDVGQVGKDGLDQGGLARLPGPGHRDHRVLGKELLYGIGEGAWDHGHGLSAVCLSSNNQ